MTGAIAGSRERTPGPPEPLAGGREGPWPLVAVVIVGYNGKALLADCLRSVLDEDYPNKTVVYVDNASSDGSLSFVMGRFPSVVAIDSRGNLGYCGGNNIGIEVALANDAEFVLLLNPDTVVIKQDFIRELVRYAQGNAHVGKVGPTVYLREKGVIQNTILEWPAPLGSVGRRSTKPCSSSVRVAQEVESINGCCVLIRSAALREVGALDHQFWGYVDEADWDWRAERKGWKRHYVPVESIVHLQRVDGYQKGSRPDYLIKRNTALWFLKAGRPWSMLTWMAGTILLSAVRALPRPWTRRSSASGVDFLKSLAREYLVILRAVPVKAFALGDRARPQLPIAGLRNDR